jgi:triphosphoribosyl-dephospho-CoA synthase
LDAQNVSKASPIEQWAYFMVNADKLTLDDVKRIASVNSPTLRNNCIGSFAFEVRLSNWKLDVNLAEQIEFACLMEATARKPGNVHPEAAFDDLHYDDFVQAARAISEPLAKVRDVGLGCAIFDAIRATKKATGTNVNLGIVLLLAPLVAVPEDIPLEEGLPLVLSGTTVDDAERVYAAICLAQPGGLGDATSQDIRERPTVTLREAMALAATRDRIAEQYVDNFKLVFEARKKLCELLSCLGNWDAAIVSLHVWILSRWPDTLIARKCGWQIAEQCSLRAEVLMQQTGNEPRIDPRQLDEFDAWLRADGHRRNPGTTADLIAATLFAGLRDGLIDAPSREEIETIAKSPSP